MQPSEPEARGYTLPTAMLCTSKYPESSVQMRARTSPASSCLPYVMLPAALGRWQGGLHCLACPRAPHWAQHRVGQEKPTSPCGTDSQPSITQKAASVLWLGSPKLVDKPPVDKQRERGRPRLRNVPAAAR